MKKKGIMNRYVTWVDLPRKKMAHWERLGEFSLIIAGRLRETRGVSEVREDTMATMCVMSTHSFVL